MKKLSASFDHVINALLAIAMTLIVVLVFSNVVLRYIFSSGVIWSQELSRYLFVWLVFLGAIAAFKENKHLSVNMVIKRMPRFVKKILVLISYGLMFYILTLVFQGSWRMTVLNIDSKSPATGLPLSVIYVTGLLLSVGIGFMLITKAILLLLNKVDVDELTPRNEVEELVETHQEDKH